MKGKLPQPKPPLTRRRPRKSSEPKKSIKSSNSTDDSGSENLQQNNIKTLSPKSKCFKTKPILTNLAKPSTSGSVQKSAFDYDSDGDSLESAEPQDSKRGVQLKRKWSSSQDESSSDNKSRYKKSQLALKNVNTDNNGKKRKVPKSLRTSDLTSDEADFSDKLIKKPCLSVPCKGADVVSKDVKAKVGKNNILKLKRNKTTQKTTTTVVDGAVHAADSNKEVELEQGQHDEQTNNSSLNNNKSNVEENNQESLNQQTCKDVKEEMKCPVCKKVFDTSEELTAVNQHVNNCIDSQTEDETDIQSTERSGNTAQSSLSLLQDKLLAFEYQNKKNSNTDIEGEEDMFFCQICQKDLSKMNTQRRTQHMNKCCDKIESVEGNQGTQDSSAMEASNVRTCFPCPFCSLEMKSKKSLLLHIKKCAQKHNVPTTQLLEIKKQVQEMDSVTKNEASNNPVQPKKRKNIKQNLRGVDEDTQLALAMSASMAPPSVPDDDGLVKKQKRKRNKGNEVIPALLLRSQKETNEVIAARAAEVVCTKNDDSDDDDISCTPALAPSSLAQRFVEVAKANEELSSMGNTSSNLPQDKVSKDTSVSLNSASRTDTNEPANEQQRGSNTTSADIPVISLAEIKDNYEMCQSFLSFLDVDDEIDDTTESKKNTSKEMGYLWSLASLNIEESSKYSFYVPGLLPVCSPKRPRAKTPRKLSNRSGKSPLNLKQIEDKNCTKSTVQNKDVLQNLEDKPLGTPKDNSSSNLCETDTASQAINVDILLELAESSDEEDSTQPINSSCDFGDVLPSSGFCVPIPSSVQADKIDASPSPSVNKLLKDLSNMVGNSLLSDVTIVTEGNQTIPAHSFMLASRCEVLADMVKAARVADSENKTCNTDVSLTFNDVDVETMRCVLQFIYTATVNMPQQLTLFVKRLADRLNLEELANLCLSSLENSQQQQHDQENDGNEGKTISPEDLLDAIWERETGNSDLKLKNQEHSQKQREEGFDDDEIQEVRIFQTQSTFKMRTMSEEQRNQDSLRDLLGLENERDTSMKEQCDTMHKCDSDGQNIDNHQRDSEIRDTSNQEECDKKCDLSENNVTTRDDKDGFHDELCENEHRPASVDQSCNSEGEQNPDVFHDGPKKEEGRIHCSASLDHNSGDLTIEKVRDTTDCEMRDIDDDEIGDISGNNVTAASFVDEVDLTGDEVSVHSNDNMKVCKPYDKPTDDSKCQDIEGAVLDGSDRRKTSKHYCTPKNVGVCQDIEGTVVDGSDRRKASEHYCTPKDDGVHQDIEETLVDGTDGKRSNKSDSIHQDIQGRLEDGSVRNETSIPCNYPIEDSMYDGGTHGKNVSKPSEETLEFGSHTEDSMYEDIDNDSDEYDGNVAILNQSISLLSDDDDEDDDGRGISSPQEKSIDGIVPETPHPKTRRTSSNRNTTLSPHKSRTEVMESVSKNTPSGTSSSLQDSDSDAGDDEDGDAFLEKLRANMKANRVRGKSKRKKTPSKKKRNQASGRKSSTNKEKQAVGASGGSLRRSRVSPISISRRNEKEDDLLTSDYSTAVNDSSDNEKDNSTERRESDVSSSSYHSAVRVLSPTVPSPPYPDNDPPSPIMGDVNHDDFHHQASPLNYPSPIPTTPLSPPAESPPKVDKVDLTFDERQTTKKGGRDVSESEVNCSESESEKSGFTYKCSSTRKDNVHSDEPSYLDDETGKEKSVCGSSTSSKARERSSQQKRGIKPVQDDKNCLTSSQNKANEFVSSQPKKDVDTSTSSHIFVDDFHYDNSQPQNDGDPSTSNQVDLDDFPDDGGYNCDVDYYLQGDDNSQPQNDGDASTSNQVDLDDFPDDGGYNCDVDYYLQGDDSGQSKNDEDPGTSNQVDLDDFPDDGGYNCDIDHYLQGNDNSQPKTNEDASNDVADAGSHDDGGCNSDANEFADCLQGDDSFFANAADQLDQLNKEHQSSNAFTPVGNAKKQNVCRGANSKVPSPITPIPDFQNMDTPDLRNEVRKYGVRALPKKKMVAKLYEITDYVRQVKHGNSSSQSVAQTSNPSSKVTVRAASQIRDNSDSDEDSGPSKPTTGRRATQGKTTKKGRQKRDNNPKENVDIHLQETFPVEDFDSVGGGETDDKSTGVATENSDNEDEEFGEVSVLIDDEARSSQQVQSDDLHETLRLYITNNQDIYLKVLHYQPIDFMALHEQIKSDGIQCSAGKLLDFLDSQCITFTTAGQKPRRTRKKAPKKK